ncbi:hypothetical protein JW992_02370 [candidate division KSB1 bacterium]|nr:hypothetical protein [candidate division KSB1 bacterium]
MNIQFLNPFSNAWERMKRGLFKPFVLSNWFAIGFTAFLAQLADGGGGGGGNGRSIRNIGDHSWGDILFAPYRAWEWLSDHSEWAIFIIFILLAVVAFAVFILYISSRGKFMFLDNVVHIRALVAKPWNTFRAEARSLFLWRVAYTAIVVLIFGALVWTVWQGLQNRVGQLEDGPFPVLYLVGNGLLFLFFLLAVAYVELLLSHFIVPIMYKQRINAVDAWNRFLPLHWRYFGHFFLYALFLFFLYIGVGVLAVVFGLFTCCCGFLLLLIPYINSVVTLPVTYTMRAFSFEFLAQFGNDFALIDSDGTPLVESE